MFKWSISIYVHIRCSFSSETFDQYKRQERSRNLLLKLGKTDDVEDDRATTMSSPSRGMKRSSNDCSSSTLNSPSVTAAEVVTSPVKTGSKRGKPTKADVVPVDDVTTESTVTEVVVSPPKTGNKRGRQSKADVITVDDTTVTVTGAVNVSSPPTTGSKRGRPSKAALAAAAAAAADASATHVIKSESSSTLESGAAVGMSVDDAGRAEVTPSSDRNGSVCSVF